MNCSVLFQSCKRVFPSFFSLKYFIIYVFSWIHIIVKIWFFKCSYDRRNYYYFSFSTPPLHKSFFFFPLSLKFISYPSHYWMCTLLCFAFIFQDSGKRLNPNILQHIIQIIINHYQSVRRRKIIFMSLKTMVRIPWYIDTLKRNRKVTPLWNHCLQATICQHTYHSSSIYSLSYFFSIKGNLFIWKMAIGNSHIKSINQYLYLSFL